MSIRYTLQLIKAFTLSATAVKEEHTDLHYMKTFKLFILVLLVTLNTQAQIDLYNSVTREKLKKEDGAVVTINAKQGYFVSFYDKFIPPDGPHEVSLNRATREVSFSFPYNGETYQIANNWGVISYTFTITAPYFETTTMSRVVSNWVNGPFSYRYIGPWNQKANEFELLSPFKINIGDVYLVPKKEVLEADLTIRSQSSNDLGLLTTKDIANALTISEEDVISLITKGELKGKKSVKSIL